MTVAPMTGLPTVVLSKNAYGFTAVINAPGASLLTLQREVNGVVQNVDGAERILPIADDTTVHDFTAMQHVMHKYRAIRYDNDPLNPGGLVATVGDWVATPQDLYLDFGADVIFHAARPEVRMPIIVEGFDAITRKISQSVVHVIGRADPVVVSGVRSYGAGTLRLITLEDQDRRDLLALLSMTDIIAFSPHQPTYGFDFVPFYAVGDVVEERPSPRGYQPARRWTLNVQRVDAPRPARSNVGGTVPPPDGPVNPLPPVNPPTPENPDPDPTPARRWADYTNRKWTDIDHVQWRDIAGL